MVKVLVLGAYGLIGSACVAALQARGASVVGMGRATSAAMRAHPEIEWTLADITRVSVDEWRLALCDIDTVVNAAGALQESRTDRLAEIHETAVARLCEAAKGSGLRLIQVSAAGASARAPTAFMRTKARGDAIVQASGLDWVVLRPSLVIGAHAYGGTALLRATAGLPMVGPKLFDASPIQSVSLHEVAGAVAACAFGAVPMRTVYDLTEPTGRTFGETIAMVRGWLGFPPFAARVPIPRAVVGAVGRMADGLGWLGWKSPMRTNALVTLEAGVKADPTAWRAAGQPDFASLPQTLSQLPSTLQERWFARLYLLMPAMVVLLSLFWLVSGLMGIARLNEAAAVLSGGGFADGLSRTVVVAGSVVDMGLGLALAYRPWARAALLGMCGVSVGYMLGAALFAPALWADPLGPMVKVFPAIGLAVVCHAMLEER